MKKMDIKEILKKKWAKYVIVGGACFVIGTMSAGPDQAMVQAKETLPKVTQENTQLKDKVKTLEEKNQTLEEKNQKAAPYFAMQESEQKEIQAKASAEKDKAEKEALEAKSKTLGAGEYEIGIGKDIEPGKYNIQAVAGGGNVMGSGVNAIMGKGQSYDMYVEDYNNANLRSGAKLKITQNLKIKLVPAK